MKIVLIAGSISDVGKTFTIALLLKKIKTKSAAIKVVSCRDPINHKCPKDTGCGVCLSVGNKPYIIHKKPEIINTPNTDTGRMATAGASQVLWLVCQQKYLEEGLHKIIGLTAKTDILLIEGNSVGKTDTPDIIFMLLSPDGKIKKSAIEIWDKVAFFVINKTNGKSNSEILSNQQLPVEEHKVIDLNCPTDIDKILSRF